MASPRTRAGAAIRRVSVETRVALGLGIAIGLLLTISLTGCAETIGDMRGNIALPSNVPTASRPLEPSRPPRPAPAPASPPPRPVAPIDLSKRRPGGGALERPWRHSARVAHERRR